MINSLAYAIVLMGCSDDMTMCNELTKDDRAFDTLAQCEMAQEQALLSKTALEIDYPVVATKCVAGAEKFVKAGSAYIGR